MAKVSPREWRNGDGSLSRKFQLTYYDKNGARHRKLFGTKREAERERIRVEGGLVSGTFVADRDSVTVRQAAHAWLDHVDGLCRSGRRARSTYEQYRQHVTYHIATTDLADIKLSRLTTPDCQAFMDGLARAVSLPLALKVAKSLRTLIRFAVRKGWVVTNAAVDATIETSDRTPQHIDEAEIPTRAQVKAVLAAAAGHDATGRAHALISVGIFTGMRMSEIRALRRANLGLGRNAFIDVKERADKWGVIGPCKTKASYRRISLGPESVAAIRRWLLSAPASARGLVFPNGNGHIESHANIYERLWVPLLMAADLMPTPKKGERRDSAPWGPHIMRHVHASLCIRQGMQPKQLQKRMGHASLKTTMDLYGHWWSDADADLAAARAIENQVS